MSNYNRAEDLLRRIGAFPADLARGQVDGRWPEMDRKLRLVEEELDEAEARGAAEAEEK